MDFFKPLDPIPQEESEEEHTPFNSIYQFDAFKEFMVHLRFNHLVQDKKVKLSQKLELALEKNIGPHAHVILNDKVYKCQVLMLRIYCQLFRDNLKFNELVKLPPGAITNESFEMAYAWMTSNNVYCPRDQLLDLLKAATFLMCPPLVESILKCLGDHRCFFGVNALTCYLNALEKGDSFVADMMLKRMGRAFLVLVGTQEYLHLNVNCLCDLLGSNYLEVQSEIEIFYSALIWIISDYQNRKNYAARVLSKVRFHMMPPAFLLYWAFNLEEFEEELAGQICKYLYNAMLTQQENYMQLFMSNYNINGDRLWIRDPKCPYAKCLDSNDGSELSYAYFFHYLWQIRKSPKSYMARVQNVEYYEDSLFKRATAEEDSHYDSMPSLPFHRKNGDKSKQDLDTEEDLKTSETDMSLITVDIRDAFKDKAFTKEDLSTDKDNDFGSDTEFDSLTYFYKHKGQTLGSNKEIETDLLEDSFKESSTDCSSTDSEKEFGGYSVDESDSDPFADLAVDSTADLKTEMDTLKKP
ncbi:uncharacterized protein LOC108146588 [Drosophila elegans]|uniref:uncharacterized protein LOC108146588 n=1 Tax=Drosophila elegans TaxID=30023 RepID=UPI0007E60150|nr:uncharacterized protein LOC108146588 [Drosophila elegans]